MLKIISTRGCFKRHNPEDLQTRFRDAQRNQFCFVEVGEDLLSR